MADSDRALHIVRWIARISATLAAGLILLIFVGEAVAEGFVPLTRLSVGEWAMMVAFAAIWAGLLVSWRWELFGGLLTICGLAAFYLLDYLLSASWPRGPYFLILASPAVLFLYCAWQTRGREDTERRRPKPGASRP